MAFWDRVAARLPRALRSAGGGSREPVTQFSSGLQVLDLVLRELSQGQGPVTRPEALSVPAVLRARNLLCSIATLPLQKIGPQNAVVTGDGGALFAQFDPDVPNVVHISQTIEDLIFCGVAWWEVTRYGWDGFPAKVRRRDPALVSVDPPRTRQPSPLPSGIDPRDGVVWVEGRPVSGRDIIRFDSPNPGILYAGSRAVRRALVLAQASAMFAQNPPAREWFTPKDGEEVDDAEITKTLNDWQARRRANVTGFVPAWVDLKPATGYTPAELQLLELTRQASLEVAQMLGLDPEDLGVSTTSRTYANVNDRRRDRINDTYAPYMRAITDRLGMGDVTPRGYTVRFDLADFLKANAAERWANYAIALDRGVIDEEEVRAAEGWTPGAPGKPAPAPAPAPTDPVPTEETPVQANQSARSAVLTFGAEDTRTFVRLALQTFTVDRDSRIIEGLAVPYGAVGNGARFEKGALKWSDPTRVKLNMDHDPGQTVGVAAEIKDSTQGLRVRFRVARTAEGDRALTLAEDGVYDGLSIEIPADPQQVKAVPDPRRRGAVLIQDAPLLGVALTPSPAFDDARLTRVKFTHTEETTVPDTDTTPVTESAVTQPEPPAVVPAQFTADEMSALRGILTAGQGRTVVNPVRPVATATVTEPTPYRFNRNGALVRGTHDLAADLFAWHTMRDLAAYNRALGFMRTQFADDPIALADVDELNPTINQARYVDERDYAYPLWSRLGRGAPPNGVQPFQWPKFLTSGIVIATHTLGTAQDSKDYQTDKQTVTPVAKSGRVEIPREVWDMGGTPGLSDLIWRKIMRAWGEEREAVIDAALDAAEVTGLAELATFTAGGGTDKQTLAAEMEAGLALLNFARGGFRFEFVATQADLYAALAAAKDDLGRALYPQTAPQNANGGAAGRWASMTVGGVEFLPSWAGAASGQVAPASSFLIDPTAVDAWSTEPQRLDIVQSVEYIEIAAWGYMAAAVNDFPGVRHISYDPVP